MFRRFLFAAALAIAPIYLQAASVRPVGNQPALRARSLRSGTVLAVRVEQPVSSRNAVPGIQFTGYLAVDLVESGRMLLPAATPVTLRVAEVQRGGYSNTMPRITIEAVAITIQGDDGSYSIPILTNSVTRTGIQINQQRLQSFGTTAAVLVGRYGGYYPNTYGGIVQSSSYQDARFIPGDVVRLSLNEEMLLH